MGSDLTGWRHIEFDDVPTLDEFKALTLSLLARGITNSDRMRDAIRSERKWIVAKASSNWNDTPSGKFTNQHAHSLKLLGDAGMIIKIADTEYRLPGGQVSDGSAPVTTVPEHSLIALNRLSMALRNNGYHIEVDAAGGWMAADATSAPGRCFLRYADADATDVLVGTSLAHVVRALVQEGWSPATTTIPVGCSALFLTALADVPRRVARMHALSLALPSAPEDRFRAETARLPAITEAERLVIQRVGQSIFREALLAFWSGRCAVTGVAQAELLRASHIKPWAACETAAERLNPMNGLLLAAHWDAAFDAGLVTFEDDGTAVFSPYLGDDARRMLAPPAGISKISALRPDHAAFLSFHRTHLFAK